MVAVTISADEDVVVVVAATDDGTDAATAGIGLASSADS